MKTLNVSVNAVGGKVMLSLLRKMSQAEGFWDFPGEARFTEKIVSTTIE